LPLSVCRAVVDRSYNYYHHLCFIFSSKSALILRKWRTVFSTFSSGIFSLLRRCSVEVNLKSKYQRW